MNNININALKIGQSIKNYKELCILLNQPILSGGDSKKSQIKEFARYFEYEKVGQKFIILDIYDEPLEKNDKRKLGNNTIYVKYIESILLRYLSKQSGYTCTLTKHQMWSLLGMVNDKYKNIELSELKKIDDRVTPFEYNNFYQRSSQKLEKILFTALKNLVNRCLLSYYEQVVVVNLDGRYKIASDNDIRKIDSVRKSVLEEMGLDSIQQVFCKYLGNEFYSKVNEKLCIMYSWQYSFKQYKLIYTRENVLNAITDQEIGLFKLTLNEKVIDAINEQAVNNVKKQQIKQKKMLTEYAELLKNEYFDMPVDNKDLKIFTYPYCYIELQKMLSEELLRIGNKKSVITNFTLDEDPEIDALF